MILKLLEISCKPYLTGYLLSGSQTICWRKTGLVRLMQKIRLHLQNSPFSLIGRLNSNITMTKSSQSLLKGFKLLNCNFYRCFDTLTIRILRSSKPVQLDPAADKNLEIDFTYTVEWIPTEMQFSDRFSKYLDSNFFEHKVNHDFNSTCSCICSDECISYAIKPDSLVLNCKFLHDGHLPGVRCIRNSIANAETRLCSL